MDKDLLKRLLLIRANPGLANTIPQGEIFAMLEKVIKAFGELQKAVSDGRLKGADGYSPVAGKDYPTERQLYQALNSVLDQELSKLTKQAEKVLSSVKSGAPGKDGKDAVITEKQVNDIAKLAAGLVVLPDVATIITQEPQAIRDALELLQDEERLDIKAIRGLDKFLDGKIADLSSSLSSRIASQGGTSKNLVRKMIEEIDLDDLRDVDASNPNNNATIQYQTATGIWTTGISITVSDTAPTDPKFGDLWIDTN
jgi:hypothetical protein